MLPSTSEQVRACFFIQDRQLRTYRGLSCLQLCDGAVASLPREIRDMSYEYVLYEDVYQNSVRIDHEHRNSDFEPLASFESNLPNRLCVLGVANEISFLWDRRCVGDRILLELAESFYRTKTFCFSGDALHLMPTFLAFPEPSLLRSKHSHLPRLPVLSRSVSPNLLPLQFFNKIELEVCDHYLGLPYTALQAV